MENKFSILLLTSCLILAFGCKKNESLVKEDLANDLAPFFTPGKGFRHVYTVSEATAGFVSFFQSKDLSATDDGKLHWVYDRHNPFSKSRYLYRSTINASTGELLPTQGKPVDKLADNYQWYNNANDINKGDRVNFVPYTGNLYLSYQSAGGTFSASGDVPRFDYLDYSFNQHPYIYANGDVYMSFFETGSTDIARVYSRITTFIWRNGIKSKGAGIARQLWNYRDMAIDSLWHKAISFPAGNNGESLACTFDEHSIYLYDDKGKVVATTPFAGRKFPTTGDSYAADIKWYAKTSKDMKKVTLMVADVDRKEAVYYYSTFSIDVATKKITVLVNNASIAKTPPMDFDLDGNIYYGSYPEQQGAVTEVIKVNASGGKSVIATNFIGRQLVEKLYALNGKVYITAVSTATVKGENVTRLTLLESN
ncbi:hypothetical protein [Pedobacter sp. Leaf250]|uniref:hypothetical protein n=1 Tax=Pedobacter sp. Leaf250 TaxID=2876559 RepID=UPI001E633933|nr:hypothetical protein [Pedobacter sp. Leaf250]